MQQSTLAFEQLHNYVSYACVALHLHGLVYCSFKSFNRRNLFQTSSLAWHSAQDVLLYVSDSLLQAIDTGQYVGAIFLDLAKAFDCVNHDILLQKLDCNSIEGCAYEWMKSFLCGRTQQVCVQNTISSRGLEFLKGLYWDLYCFLFMLMTYQIPLAFVTLICTLMMQSYATVIVNYRPQIEQVLQTEFIAGWQSIDSNCALLY